MGTVVRILLVEEVPLVRDVYNWCFSAMAETERGYDYSVQEASTCGEALSLLRASRPEGGFDLVVLAYYLPPSGDKKFASGEDVAFYIRKQYPQTRILFNAEITGPIIRGLINRVNPEGILLKHESTREIFKRACREILNGGTYYSHDILAIMRTSFSDTITLDVFDRKILNGLAKGVRMVQLVDIIPLSRSAIARRKRRLKEMFDVRGDWELVERAREMGFL